MRARNEEAEKKEEVDKPADKKAPNRPSKAYNSDWNTV
jgi:hypothetical protein